MFTIVSYGAKFFDRNTAQIQRNAPRISLLRATCEEQTAQRRENVRAYDVSGLSTQLSGAALVLIYVPPEVDEGWRGRITASPESLSPRGK